MLGIAFMPRLKDLADQQPYKLDKDADHGTLEPLFRGTVDAALIAEQWDQLIRLAASLRPHDRRWNQSEQTPTDKAADDRPGSFWCC